MKTKEENQKKEFDSVEIFRKIKHGISKDLKGKSFEKIKAHLKKESLKLQAD
jgi:hypothetical protein